MVEKRKLSKSQMNLYKQCPLKWKFRYIDKLSSEPSEAMERGIMIHKQIEEFYSKIKLVSSENIPHLELGLTQIIPNNFLNFERSRIQGCVDKDGKYKEEYFKPLFQELDITSKDLALRGIIDAVYINPKDDGLIVIDWKTGKYRPNSLSGYRFELALYKELLEQSDYTNKKVLYWGIYFVDADKLFFEKVKPISIKAMWNTVNKVREGIESGNHEPKENMFCRWCEHYNKCPLWRNNDIYSKK